MPTRDTPDLFEDFDPRHAPEAAAKGTLHHGLRIVPQDAAALSPEQRKYNQLLAQLEKARVDLQAWESASRAFEQDHARQVHPQLKALDPQRHALVLKLGALLTQAKLGKAARRTLSRCLCEEAVSLVDSEFIDEPAAAELEALHDRYADTPLAEERREALIDFKEMIEAVSGLDLGHVEFDSEEALMQHAREQIQSARDPGFDEMEAGRAGEEPPSGFRAAAGRRPARKPSKRQQKKAEEQAQATLSVREVFRKLAGALHPDRAADEADRAHRTALMQRVNQAYEAQDLLTLLTLQLEIEQIDPEHLLRASSERIRHYNRVLATQLSELQSELRQRQAQFCVRFDLDNHRRLDPRRLGGLLHEQAHELRGALNRVALDLQDLEQPAGVQRFVQRERALQRMADDIERSIPF